MREIERQIERAEADAREVTPPFEKPAGIPAEFADYVKLMFDLQVAALQADLTRVVTFMMGREGSLQSYPEIGVPDSHHPLTHHRGQADLVERVTKINVFHVELFTHLVGRLAAIPTATGPCSTRWRWSTAAGSRRRPPHPRGPAGPRVGGGLTAGTSPVRPRRR